MTVLEGNYKINNSDLHTILNDVDLARALGHFIESMKHLHPGKFAQEGASGASGVSQDIFEVGNVIDFQYARLYKALERESRFKEFVISLLGDRDYREMQIDEYFSVLKPMFMAG